MTVTYILIAVLAASVAGQNDNLLVREWSGLSVPNPQVDYSECGYDSPGTVCDPDMLVVDDDMKAKLQAKLDSVEYGKYTVVIHLFLMCRLAQLIGRAWRKWRYSMQGG